jgi:hypothetical protein
VSKLDLGTELPSLDLSAGEKGGEVGLVNDDPASTALPAQTVVRKHPLLNPEINRARTEVRMLLAKLLDGQHNHGPTGRLAVKSAG